MKKSLLLLTFFLTNCASIVSDSKYPVVVNSNPAEAHIKVTNDNGLNVFSGVTPATMYLKSGSGYFSSANYTVEFTKEGYQPYSQQITSSLDSWYYGNILFGGLIGMLIVDPITGAMYELDQQQIAVNLLEDKQ